MKLLITAILVHTALGRPQWPSGGMDQWNMPNLATQQNSWGGPIIGGKLPWVDQSIAGLDNIDLGVPELWIEAEQWPDVPQIPDVSDMMVEQMGPYGWGQQLDTSPVGMAQWVQGQQFWAEPEESLGGQIGQGNAGWLLQEPEFSQQEMLRRIPGLSLMDIGQPRPWLGGMQSLPPALGSMEQLPWQIPRQRRRPLLGHKRPHLLWEMPPSSQIPGLHQPWGPKPGHRRPCVTLPGHLKPWSPPSQVTPGKNEPTQQEKPDTTPEKKPELEVPIIQEQPQKVEEPHQVEAEKVGEVQVESVNLETPQQPDIKEPQQLPEKIETPQDQQPEKVETPQEQQLEKVEHSVQQEQLTEKVEAEKHVDESVLDHETQIDQALRQSTDDLLSNLEHKHETKKNSKKNSKDAIIPS